jgi:uncharacterized protein with HEPN domain
MRDLAAFLADARDHARRGAAHVRDIDATSFASDQMRKDAVCFCLAIVGEACNEAAKRMSRPPTNIPWAEIKGMRKFWCTNTGKSMRPSSTTPLEMRPDHWRTCSIF